MKHTVIVGAGKSGMAVARHLAKAGIPAVMTDSNPSPHNDTVSQLAAWRVPGVWGSHPFSLLDSATEVIISPVVSPGIQFVQEAKLRGISVVGELEFAHRVLRARDSTAKVLAITGTNGKSTTTDLTAHLLKTGGLPAVACGNYGFPFLDAVDSAEAGARFVLECSSYQLETILNFRAEVAAILNLAPDHLLRHGDMEAYLAAKLRIFEGQSEADQCIIPASADFLSSFHTRAQVSKFGWNHIEGKGAWCDSKGNMLMYDPSGDEVDIVNRSELLIPGKHNVENAMVASLLAFLGGTSIDSIRLGLKTYPGLIHRLAFCGEKNGARAYNDSKATNVEATLTAIQALEGPLILLLGGEDKGCGYDPLSVALHGKLRHLVFMGDAVPMLERDLGDLPHTVCIDFDGAVKKALALAVPGDKILLSPACASFDQFNNFEERGERFEKLVSEWMSS
ncbi:MAG: UDP-N-acetylmuramoyl-L-alanine--D-glutamate ligase [Holophagaceae bacterium]|nr:UDP-N-acetylmuramoyl-L-alanine--D-glutamate ligase [Holophagaceae bacterium]